MKVAFWGTGTDAKNIISQVEHLPDYMEVLCVFDNDSTKWGKIFCDKYEIVSPEKLDEFELDVIYILSTRYEKDIRKRIIELGKPSIQIENKEGLLLQLYIDKYKDSTDSEIMNAIEYMREKQIITPYNNFLKNSSNKYMVYQDEACELPYIWFEDKKMYFPKSFEFEIQNGKKIMWDIMEEQQKESPHLYITDDIVVEKGDIIVDAGVCEGNFALRYVDVASKIYLFECDPVWIEALEKTFEPYKDKVVIVPKMLTDYDDEIHASLDGILGDSKIDFLKMDIEGAEISALLGGKNVLQKNNVKCALCSYHRQGDEKALKEILEDYGYQTNISKGYMTFIYDKNIWSTLDFRRGIVYGKKS